MHAYVTSDFSVLNVVQNSHSAKPMLYKISGVWGNHEGSMLLWVLILAIFGAAVRSLWPVFTSSIEGTCSIGTGNDRCLVSIYLLF